jgi:hypothetical protein
MPTPIPAKQLVAVNSLELTSVAYSSMHRYELFPIGAGQTTLPIVLPINHSKGALSQVSFQSLSKNMDLYLLVHPDAALVSMDCIWSAKAINLVHKEFQLFNLWMRGDYSGTAHMEHSIEGALYLVAVNNDVIASGQTVFEFVYQYHML